jgi:hypothetical protein
MQYQFQEAIVTNNANENHATDRAIPVVDVDQTFPLHTVGGSQRAPASGTATQDQAVVVDSVLRDVLGWRPRTQDPKAFVDALSSTFQLSLTEGHVESRYVPRGFAVNAELGAVTGGQASLWSRARAAHTEMTRILEGLTPLRTDADAEDMAAYRTLVRDGLDGMVNELGAAGGPRIQLVNTYFRTLTGLGPNQAPPNTPDEISGQLGALRDRFGLVDANVNTVAEEGIRTSFWTLVDLVTDIKRSWDDQRARFAGKAGFGFLGTDLILLARLMEATADQVDELEAVLDSVLISASERQTLELDDQGLTLDGLLSWLRVFLTKEGRRIAQDAGRDGIVSALAPTAIELFKVFKKHLADPVGTDLWPSSPSTPIYDTEFAAVAALGAAAARAREACCPVRYLPASCCAALPAGMYAARTKVTVASLCRLLWQLVKTVQRIGRWPGVVLLDVRMTPFVDQTAFVHVEVRGLNLRSTFIPAFVPSGVDIRVGDQCEAIDDRTDNLVRALRGSSSGDEERLAAIFDAAKVPVSVQAGGAIYPAEDIPLAIIDGELGRIIYAPEPTTWPGAALASIQVSSPPNNTD